MTPNLYIVTYASAGCLPDGPGDTFDSIEDARAHVASEWETIARECAEWTNDSGEDLTSAALDALEAIDTASGPFTADDPRPGSLYRWEVAVLDTFTTQEGCIFDMRHAVCPRCKNPSSLAHHRPHHVASFLCPSCGLMYDEPTFTDAEVAYMGQAEDFD